MAVLDTSFLIALENEDQQAMELLQWLDNEPLLVPDIVAVEYLTPYGEKAPRAYDELERAFHLVSTSPEWVLEASRLRHRLHERGVSIRLVDFWIATWASMHDTAIVTRNEGDFEAFGVPIETW